MFSSLITTHPPPPLSGQESSPTSFYPRPPPPPLFFMVETITDRLFTFLQYYYNVIWALSVVWDHECNTSFQLIIHRHSDILFGIRD